MKLTTTTVFLLIATIFFMASCNEPNALDEYLKQEYENRAQAHKDREVRTRHTKDGGYVEMFESAESVPAEIEKTIAVMDTVDLLNQMIDDAVSLQDQIAQEEARATHADTSTVIGKQYQQIHAGKALKLKSDLNLTLADVAGMQAKVPDFDSMIAQLNRSKLSGAMVDYLYEAQPYYKAAKSWKKGNGGVRTPWVPSMGATIAAIPEPDAY